MRPFLLAIALVFVGTTVPAAAEARVIDCHISVGPTIGISSARNMSCSAAVRVMRRNRSGISRRFKTQGFTCARVSGLELGGQWRCVAGSRAFRFEFGD